MDSNRNLGSITLGQKVLSWTPDND